MDIKVGRKAIEEASKKLSNWGRWGKDDHIGTLNHVTPENIADAAQLIKTGKVFALGIPLDREGPQNGLFGGRFNPIHQMLATGTDAVAGQQDWNKIRYADDTLNLCVQGATPWGDAHSGRHLALEVLRMTPSIDSRESMLASSAVSSTCRRRRCWPNAASPMRGALHAEVQRVVGIADLVPVLLAGDRVGAGRQHLVDRVEAARTGRLRALAIERDSEREHLAGLDELRRVRDVLRRDVIERADVVVLAPAAPVGELLGGLLDRLAPPP